MKKIEITYNSELKELEKRLARVERKEKSLEKATAKAEKLGVINWSNDDRLSWLETVEKVNDMWIANKEDQKKNGAWFDYHTAIRELEEAKASVERSEARLAKIEGEYKEAVAEREQDERTLKEIPKAFIEAKEYLVEEWVKHDIAQREKIAQLRRNLDYKEFRELVKYSVEEEYNKTDEEFKKIEEKEATMWLLDLYYRVKEITGEVKDASNIRWGGKCLDGYVVGEKATAEVRTIYAGGYNIQRLHLRTLVHER